MRSHAEYNQRAAEFIANGKVPCPDCGELLPADDDEARAEHYRNCERGVRVLPEFKALIPPLSPDEYVALEASLKLEGRARDALVVWREANILLDGHNRREICEANDLPYSIARLSFASKEDAQVWMIRNQLARRNINDFSRVELALKMKPALEEIARRNMVSGGKGDKILSPLKRVNDQIANSADASYETVRKVEVISKAPAPVLEKARSGEISTHRAYELTRALAQADDEIRAACIRYDVTDPQLVTLLNTKQTTDTVQTVLTTGCLQTDKPEETKPLSEASAWDLQGLLRRAEKEHRRRAADATLADKHAQIQNAPDGVYSVVYADCPWHYDNSGLYGAAATIYPPIPTDDLLTLPERIHLCVQDDAVLFLWATNPLLPDALRVITAWGFEYRTNIVWDKEAPTTGLGFYVKGQHELLLIATRGQFRPNYLPTSVLREHKGDHSRKPASVYSLIETMYPNQRYIELFARDAEERDDWQFYGGEA